MAQAKKVVSDEVLNVLKEVNDMKGVAEKKAEAAQKEAKKAKEARDLANAKLMAALAPLIKKREEYSNKISEALDNHEMAVATAKDTKAAVTQSKRVLELFYETAENMGIPRALIGAKKARNAVIGNNKGDAGRKTLKPAMVGMFEPLLISVPKPDNNNEAIDLTVHGDGTKFHVMFAANGEKHQVETARLSEGTGRFAHTKDVAYAIVSFLKLTEKYPAIRPTSAPGAIRVNGIKLQ